MLSDKDIVKQLGKGITIYPFNEKNIDGVSLYVTASPLAWSLKSKKTVVEKDGKLIIPAHDTALILSNEFIGLSGKYSGTCHSRVGLLKKGLGQFSTPIKPYYPGKLCIPLQNVTSEPIAINVNERIAVILFYELKTKAVDHGHAREPETQLSRAGINLTKEEETAIYDATRQHGLDEEIIEKYKKFKKERLSKGKSDGWLKNNWLLLSVATALLVVVQAVLLFTTKEQNIRNALIITLPVTGKGLWEAVRKING